MKKSLKTLLVMAVVLVVLGGAAVALWLTAPEPEVEEESSSSTPSYPVIDREAADVESISIESDAGDFNHCPPGGGDLFRLQREQRLLGGRGFLLLRDYHHGELHPGGVQGL